MLGSPVLVLLALVGGAGVVGLLWMRDRQALIRDTARLEAERDAAERSLAARRETRAQNQPPLRAAFDALARSALRENRQDFLHDAGQLFQPVRETLDKV